MTRYETALEEYENENEDGKHKTIYAYFGLAIYFGQILEETFSTMLWVDGIFKNKVKTNKEVREIIDAIENSKKTMGKYINDVKNSYQLSEKLIRDLETILEKRNYLVHKYFKIEIQKSYSELGRKEMLKYFCDFIEQSENLDSTLTSYYKEYKLKMGFTDEKIEELVEQMKNDELKREKNNKA